MDGGFGGLGGEAVHDLERGGEHAGGDDVGDGLAGGGDGVEGGEEDLHGFGAFDDAEGDCGGDAERAFGADEDAGEVVAGGVEAPAEPKVTSSPAGRTTSMPRTWVVVKPYLRQWAPPAFSATLPPMVQTVCEEGSGA